MKLFLTKLGVFSMVILLWIAFSFHAFLKRYPVEESYYASSLDKLSLLQTQAPPRLILVGGSSVALGMDSLMVAEACGHHPVNLGLNMGVGLEFMLHQARLHLLPGDTVLVAPEYHTFTTHYRANPEFMARLLECVPQLLGALSWKQIQDLLDEGYQRHVGRILRTVLGDNAGTLDALLNEHNRRSSFNAFGDVVTHHGKTSRRVPPVRFELKDTRTARMAIAHLNRFHQECRRKGVRVFFSHAPYDRKYFDLYRDDIRRLEAMLRKDLTIPMLDHPADTAFPSEYFFDTEFHLTYSGKILRSRQVADRLASALARSEKSPAP